MANVLHIASDKYTGFSCFEREHPQPDHNTSLRGGGRVVDGVGPENRRTERFREFESHPPRQFHRQSAGVAQLVEHLICNQGVAGSNPRPWRHLNPKPERRFVDLGAPVLPLVKPARVRDIAT